MMGLVMLVLGSALLVLTYAGPSRLLQDRPSPDIKANSKAEACCGDLGCFSSGGAFFDLLNRPINSVPVCNLAGKLVLHLNTRANPIQTQILDSYDSSTIAKSNFDPKKETKVLIHGFLDNYRWPWWTATVRELLEHGDFNVVRLDWSHGNTFPYTQATANSRLVGAFVTRFLLHLRDVYDLDLDKVHLIGHSLGAQASGYVGEAMVKAGGQIGRISGLDPAGPYFANLPAEVRLDPSDAKFVDTIVTDGEDLLNTGIMPGFGTLNPMGHINFYPNGGKNQPGCNNGILSSIFTGPTMNATEFSGLGTVAATVLDVIACSHARAVVLFYDAESINNRICQMKSFECDSYEQFLRGDCFQCVGGKCTPIGYHADKALAEPGKLKKFYTITMKEAPFCTNPYKVRISLQKKTSENNAKTQDGWVYVTLYGNKGTTHRVKLNEKSMKFVAGESYTFFFETPKELGSLKSVVFSWEADTFLLNPLDWIRTFYLHLETDIFVTEADEMVSIFQLTRNKVESEKDTLANLVHYYQQ